MSCLKLRTMPSSCRKLPKQATLRLSIAAGIPVSLELQVDKAANLYETNDT